MNVGDTVYLCWYDFNTNTEWIQSGVVEDNSLYEGTQWQNYVNVRFRPYGMSAEICHHFLPEKLTTRSDNVPHDDCYLVCGKKTRNFEHDPSVRLKNTEKLNTPDAWQRVQQFKQDHWDYQHGHLAIDALDEYYDLWRNAIAAKRCCTVPCGSPARITTAVVSASHVPSVASVSNAAPPRPHPKKQKPSTNAIQLSIFD